MRKTLWLATLLGASLPALAVADNIVDDNHVIDNDRVGQYRLGATEKDVLDQALKEFTKNDLKLVDGGVELPHVKLHFTGGAGKRTLSWIELEKPTFGASPYKTRDGVGPGSSEKDVRLAYRNAVKRRKINTHDGLTPDVLPSVHFVCNKGGVFTADSCPIVTVRKGGR